MANGESNDFDNESSANLFLQASSGANNIMSISSQQSIVVTTNNFSFDSIYIGVRFAATPNVFYNRKLESP